jgi:two-component system, OmpR family, alkaline phosphatase synthesis response regulator PhoP
MAKRTVLVIDDEEDLIELVRYNLEMEGFGVLSAVDGESGFSQAVAKKPDVILVDLMLPGVDGLEVCRMLRADSGASGIPIIILTAKASEADRVVGLELGADDYITKPFSPRELIARIKALLRRSAGLHQPLSVLRHGSLSIEPASHEVRCSNKVIDLTATEYRLLQFLASHPGFVYSRSSIIDGALGRDITVLERTIDVHIMSLRKKLGKCGDWIETIRGFGYKFRESDGKE